MIRRPPRSTQSRSSAASDVYKRQPRTTPRAVPRPLRSYARPIMKGVVAAGHPLTAEAGADALRAGGNAVDAAVAAVLMSFVAESPLTGPGAGGFMLVHTGGGEDHLLDFFVAAPGRGLDDRRPAALEPAEVRFSDDAAQLFHIGPSSCGAY